MVTSYNPATKIKHCRTKSAVFHNPAMLLRLLASQHSSRRRSALETAHHIQSLIMYLPAVNSCSSCKGKSLLWVKSASTRIFLQSQLCAALTISPQSLCKLWQDSMPSKQNRKFRWRAKALRLSKYGRRGRGFACHSHCLA